MVDVTVKVRLGGPYKVSGPATVLDSAGNVVSDGGPADVAILCRCGRSATSPTCDGTHRHDHATPS